MKFIVFFVLVIYSYETTLSMKIETINPPERFDKTETIFSNYPGLINKVKTRSENYPTILKKRVDYLNPKYERGGGLIFGGDPNGNMLLCGVEFDRKGNLIDSSKADEKKCPKIPQINNTCTISNHAVINGKVIYIAPQESDLKVVNHFIYVNDELACDLSKGIMYIKSK